MFRKTLPKPEVGGDLVRVHRAITRATDVAHEVFLGAEFFDGSRDDRCQKTDDLITFLVTVVVVESLEIIDVDIKKGVRFLAIDSCFELPFDGRVAGKPRQRIRLFLLDIPFENVLDAK